MIAMNLKKKLRIFKCACGNEIQTYNIHRKYCDDCRESKENEQKIKGQLRKAARRDRQKTDDQPLDPGKESRITGLIKKYEAIHSVCKQHKIKPQSAGCHEVDQLININA